MEEELKPELSSSAEVNISTEASVETNKESLADSLPRLEDLLKSEKEVKTSPKIEGVTALEKATSSLDKPFKQKVDKKQVLVKKRLKIITGVYISVVTLLLAFVGISTVTLAMLNKDVTTNTNTIQSQTEILKELEQTTVETPNGADIFVKLNDSRDYTDDKKELTFFDKISIMFRSLFG